MQTLHIHAAFSPSDLSRLSLSVCSNRAVDLSIRNLDTQKDAAGEIASRVASALQQLVVTAASATADGFLGAETASGGSRAFRRDKQPQTPKQQFVEDDAEPEVLLWRPQQQQRG